jgi:predicted deacylase
MTTVDGAAWFGSAVEPGGRASLSVTLSESYSGEDVSIPIQVWRGRAEGPTVCVSAAVHGDEINGTGAIRHIIRERPFELIAGTLVLVPVVNIVGFDRHTRYLPDRRDLNRSFPGSREGSLASRMAWAFFNKVTKRCQYGIDLHTAAVRRTNFPNVRANMSDERLAAFARAFGAELIVDGKGPKGSLRISACRAGCATLILEAGEVWKVESSVVEYAVRGITNCLRYLKMVEGEPEEPPYRVETDSTKWVRAEHGGFLEFHAAPGDIVEKGEAIATNTDLNGEEQNVIRAPRSGIVLGMTTIPSVAPGDPVCHLAFSKKRELTKIERVVGGLGDDSLHQRIRDDLARSLRVTTPEDV